MVNEYDKKSLIKKTALHSSYGSLEFQVWPPRSSLTSEVKVEIAVQFRIVIGAYIPNFVKIGLLEVKL